MELIVNIKTDHTQTFHLITSEQAMM